MGLSQVLFALVIVGGIVACTAIQSFSRAQRANRKQLTVLERQFGARLARLERLEERIAVLERIVTDRRYELEREFRDLDKTG